MVASFRVSTVVIKSMKKTKIRFLKITRDITQCKEVKQIMGRMENIEWIKKEEIWKLKKVERSNNME